MDHPTPALSEGLDELQAGLLEPASSPDTGPQQALPAQKSGIGGCLLYPLFFLITQPFFFVYMLATGSKSSYSNVTYHIYWPYMIYDIALIGAVVILFLLFTRKKASLPAMFIVFLISFAILSGLVANLFGRLPEARVTGRNPMTSHLVVLLQCLVLIPYFALDGRVKNTFSNQSEDNSSIDRLIKPIATTAERLYGWLAQRGKKVILYTIAFVVLVFIFDWIVDSIVLYGFLR